MLEALRGYVALASGLTEVSRRRALETARALLSQAPVQAGGPVPRQVQQLADDLLATARSNRELLEQLVRGEVLRATDALGLVREADLTALSERVDRLERVAATTTGTKRAAPAKTGTKRAATTTTGTKRAAPAKTGTKWAAATTTGTKRAAPAKTGTKRAAAKRTGTEPPMTDRPVTGA
jgi:polyhydroxyalkanoate synthesis regulator phasin